MEVSGVSFVLFLFLIPSLSLHFMYKICKGESFMWLITAGPGHSGAGTSGRLRKR